MKLLSFLVVCLLFSTSCFNNNQIDSTKEVRTDQLILDSQNYLHHYHKGDSLLSSYYLSLLDRENLRDNVVRAIASFQKSLLYTTDSIPGLQKLAECNIVLKEYSKALNHLKICSKISRSNYNTYLLLSRAYKGIGNYQRSINICDSLILSDTLSSSFIMEAALLIANIYSIDYNQKAIEYYNIVLDINPDNIKALYGKALFYQNNKMYSEAVDLYYEIKEIDPLNLDANFNLGFIFMELHSYDEAINFFTDVIVSQAQYYKAYFARGICHEKKGNIIYAEKDYRQALEIYPDYLDAQKRLEKLLLDNKKYN